MGSALRQAGVSDAALDHLKGRPEDPDRGRGEGGGELSHRMSLRRSMAGDFPHPGHCTQAAPSLTSDSCSI
jgi:hypothetical protein